MSVNDPIFDSWEEHIICHERGNRVVHFYLKDNVGDLVLAVIGTERSIRHMTYVVSDEFLNAYRSIIFMTSVKWRARREVVDWLTSLVLQYHSADSQVNDSKQDFRSLDVLVTGPTVCQTYVPDLLVPRKLKAQNMNIEWSDDAWICAKQLKHYQYFCRNGTTITVHAFVYLLGDEDNYYLGYLEDMYEDKKGQKKVKVRWFRHNQEVKSVITDLNPHPKEVFITSHVQVITAEYINGLATVLTPKHYEKCAALISQTSPSIIHMCFRQIKHNRVKPFTLPKLRGYSAQAILTTLDDPPLCKQKVNFCGLNEEDEAFTLDSLRVSAKRRKNSKEQGQFKDGFVLKNSFSANQITNGELKSRNLKIMFSGQTLGIKVILPQPQCPISFKVNEKIELLCQDSGIRGCWFMCKVLRVSGNHLKVKYDDLENADGTGNLKEWVPACRVAAPDKLGMRCPGRMTIRPWPSSDSTDLNFGVGSPVDAWWSNGWWEGVVTGVDISEQDDLQIYLPGEGKFLTVPWQDVRASKDWLGNKWVDVIGNPNILSYVSSSLKICSTVGEASGCGSSALLEHKILTTSKLEIVKEDEQELADDDRDEDEINKRGGGDNDENIDDGDNMDAGNKAKAKEVSEDGNGYANDVKFEAGEGYPQSGL